MATPQEIIHTTMSELPFILREFWRQGVTPVIHGDPGLGKTQGVGQTAATTDAVTLDEVPYGTGAPLVTYRTAQRDPTVASGAPVPDMVRRRLVWLPDESMLDVAHVLFFDELNRASTAVQNAVFGILDDRRIGSVPLPDGTRMVIAVNDADTGVNRFGQALNNRLGHIWVKPDVASWRTWAAGHGIEPSLLAYIQMYGEPTAREPGALHAPSKLDPAWPSPRSWEKVSRIITAGRVTGRTLLVMVAGLVGHREAVRYLDFHTRFINMAGITLPAILSNPATAPVPSDLEGNYAVAAALAAVMDPGNIDRILLYLERLDSPEYMVMAVTDAVTRDPRLGSTPAYTTWVLKHPDLV